MATDERALTALRMSLHTDDRPAALDPELFECALHEYHSPVPRLLERHHVIPLSWTGAVGMPDSRVEPICSTGHEAIHYFLRRRVRGDAIDGREIDERMKPFIEEAMGFYSTHRDRLHASEPVLRSWLLDDPAEMIG